MTKTITVKELAALLGLDLPTLRAYAMAHPRPPKPRRLGEKKPTGGG